MSNPVIMDDTTTSTMLDPKTDRWNLGKLIRPRRFRFITLALIATVAIPLMRGLLTHERSGTIFTDSLATSVNALPSEVPGPISDLATLSSKDCYSFPLLSSVYIDSRKEPVPANLGWSTSGIIRENRFLLADMTFSRVAQVQVGGYLDAQAIPLTDHGKNLSPTPWYIYPAENGAYWLLDVMDEHDSQLLLVDRNDQVLSRIDTFDVTLSTPKGLQVNLREVHRMAPIHDGVVVNAVFINRDLEKWWWDTFAYLDGTDLYYPLEFAEPPLESLDHLKEKFYSRDFSYIAVLGNVAFVLVPEEGRPWIGRVEIPSPLPPKPPRIEKFAVFPENFVVPEIEIPERRSLHDRVSFLHQIYKAVEGATMPVGLFPFQDRLHALVKSAVDDSTHLTEWHLLPVFDDGEFGEAIKLPASSHDLALVLGDQHLGIIEKSGIDMLDHSPMEIVYRRAHSGTLVSLEWLSDQSLRKSTCRPIKVGDGL